MIRKLGVLAVVALYLMVSTAADTPTVPDNFLLTQKTIYELLWHVDQPDKVHPEMYKLGTSWDIRANLKLYTNKVAVEEFLQRYEHGMLPREHLFSIFYKHHLDEAVALFKLFYSAGDIQTFLNTAAWARVHVNEYMFVYAFNAAVMHRPDTVHFRLPLPSEIEPEYFFNREVMQQVYDYKMSHDLHGSEPEYFIIPANYTHWYASASRDPGTKLSYYLEDVGLNNYYYFLHQETPFWMPSKKYNMTAESRGELYLYLHKVFLKRYELERLSHGMGEIESFDWNRPILTGYTPALGYRNGFRFPQREEYSYVPVHMYDFAQKAKEFESRISATIDHGYWPSRTHTDNPESIYNQKGLNNLGNIIEGNADAPHRNFYGYFERIARTIFGFSPKPYGKYQVVPSALEHYSTSMRDPAFYRICKRIDYYYESFKKHFTPYTYDDLIFKGVEIESIDIDELTTFFDTSDFLISNSMKVHDNKDAESYLIKARQFRLNHKPFSYHINIKSDKETKATVRIFLGPKFNVHGQEIDISENYKNFYQFELFTVDLKVGTNKIERKNIEASFMGSDYMGSDFYYKQIVDAIASGSSLPIVEKPYAFPERLLLPRGRPEGLPLQFFFYVSEFDEKSSITMHSRNLGKWSYDLKSLGFPLDRPVYGFNFTVPNMFFKTAEVYHKEEESEFNLTGYRMKTRA